MTGLLHMHAGASLLNYVMFLQEDKILFPLVALIDIVLWVEQPQPFLLAVACSISRHFDGKVTLSEH